jgi:hypothetical protein
MNVILKNYKSNTVPCVGMGATILGYSDRHAATVVHVENSKLIGVRQDTATRVDNNGMSENQEYVYEENLHASIQWFSLRKNGKWIREGEKLKNGTVLLLGERDEYYDFSF